MKTISVSKKFYQMALAYEDASNILYAHCDFNNQLIINPVMFLLRHAVELILKSLILLSYSDFKKNIKNFTIKSLQDKIILSKTHSLLKLLDFLIKIDSNLLIKRYNQKLLKQMRSTIKSIDKIDFSSTYFRYPINSNMQNNLQKFYYLNKNPQEMQNQSVYQIII